MNSFSQHNQRNYKTSLPGITQKILVYGEKTLMMEFVLQRNSVLPEHSHPFEQTGYLIKGHIQLKIGNSTYDVHPGDSWCIPVNVKHGAQILEDSLAVEVFSPRRDDYIPKDS